MKKDNKLAQKGGMMIEALAMLGLIAVVTPTMYKKSAERTLEVEDINTATTMRSVMTAADSYVSSHYGELIQEISANSTNNTSKTLSISDLQPYLPYGFNADKLYDFGEPQVSVVRNGNNLTAFVLFPAKEDGENGLGQERTVRIATLVGANGGYVNGNQTAKGIGGIWNLNKDDFQTVFGSTDDAKPEVYSIVTASSDAINNTNTEEDTDKFLYRTAANGKWHNTMRADLYMGGNPDDHDGYDASDPKSKPFSIRNVKSMIVGAEFAGSEAGTDTGDYGLYISEDADNPNAYVYGTLKAAEEKLSVDTEKFVYQSTDGNEMGMKIDGNKVYFGLKYPGSLSEKDDDLGKVVHSINSQGDIENYGVNVHLAKSFGADATGEFTVGNTNSTVIYASDDAEGHQRVKLLDNGEFTVDNQHGKDSINDVIVMMDKIDFGTEKGDSEDWKKEVSYKNSPVFPVRVGSNAKVDGILATAQLDTQNIRAATLEVGSAKIDDANKWLTVDASGIHGRQPSDDNYVGTGMDISNGKIKFATGLISNGKDAGSDWSTSNGAQSYIGISSGGGGIDIETTEQLDIFENNDAGKLTIRNPIVQEQISGTDVVFSSLQDSEHSTNVKIQKTNFQVSDTDGRNVLTVRGNSKTENLDHFLNFSTGNNGFIGGSEFDVSVRGETMFAPKGEEYGYLSVGIPFIEPSESGDDYTGVTIAPFKSDKNIVPTMAVDLSPDSTIDYGSYLSTIENNEIYPGTVYVRSGMVEVMPTTEDFDVAPSTKGAHEGHGFMAAGRFVANNPDPDGDGLITVPQFFTGNDYTDYNGSSDDSGRYDTYMVNPAYTSVMHDIKLTTRGGARLSDILPDFINKGIYITSNTYKDNIKKMSFKFDTSSKKVVPAGTGDEASPLSGSIILGNSDSWASPYLGFVPAPQCPPGYNRVITMAPQSFMMAQAGQMQKGSNPREAAYYVKNQVPDDTAFTNYTDTVLQNGAYVQQAFVKPTVSNNTDVTINGTTHAGAAKTQGTELSGVSDQNSAQTATYFLASFGDQTVPLTIQQSTWLKTNVIPVDNTGSSYSVGDTNSGHTVGWAALMGFVYDAATYMPVLKRLAGNEDITESKKLIQYNEGNNNVYWNVFPVRRNTLEAYATTYCYFDRNNIGGNWSTTSDFTSDKYIDHYNALTDYGNYTKEKNSKDSYKKRLNDPAMKYDEVW